MVICISLLYLSLATFYHFVKFRIGSKSCVGNHLKLIYQSLAFKKHPPFYIQMIEPAEKAWKNLLVKTEHGVNLNQNKSNMEIGKLFDKKLQSGLFYFSLIIWSMILVCKITEMKTPSHYCRIQTIEADKKCG